MTGSTASLRQVGAGVRAFLTLTLLLGLVYPLVMTGIAQVLFPGRADGSLVASQGHLVGSALIGQDFSTSPAYFQSRPSAAGNGYDPLSTGASNYGPENTAFLALIRQRQRSVASRDGVPVRDIAPDALLASGSGLDPHISPAYAEQQVPRVARERGLTQTQVRTLVARYTYGRPLGFLGEPHVNVLLLNLALDRRTGRPATTAAAESP